MTKEKTENIWIYRIAGLLCIFFFLVLLTNPLWADTITHKFKSPSFNGVGTSSHYLTIENQQYTRKLTIKEEITALQDEIKREKVNNELVRKNVEQSYWY